MYPVALLCGGKGLRSGSPINKCFQWCGDRPFILHQLEWLEGQGFTTVTLCRGDTGTLAALRNAAPRLGEKFLVCYGDTLLRIDLRDFVTEWLSSRRPMATAFYDDVDAGVSGIHRYLLDWVDRDETDFAVLRDKLDGRGLLCHYQSPVKWLEVGSPEGLDDACRVFAAERIGPFLRGMNDPEGTGLSEDQSAMIEQVERNVTAFVNDPWRKP